MKNLRLDQEEARQDREWAAFENKENMRKMQEEQRKRTEMNDLKLKWRA